MKKSYVFFAIMALFSILFFSCGSKPDASESEAFPVTEAPSEEETTEENPVTDENSEDTENEENTDDVFNGVEDVEAYPTEDGLEEITDPEVFEEELPPEEETVEITVPEEEPEPVKEEEIIELPDLPEPPAKENETSEKTDSNSDSEKPETDFSGDEKNGNDVDSVDSIDSVEDVEDVEDTDSVDTEENEEPEEIIIPSRSVKMKNGESLDVEYPGKGWIYLGCTDGSKTLTSTGRKLGASNTNFTLQARVPGTVILHFYKEDILAEKYIDDYLEVTVDNIKSKASVHVKAPAYAEVVPAKPKAKTETIKEPAKETVTVTNETEPEYKQKIEYEAEPVKPVQKAQQKTEQKTENKKTEETAIQVKPEAKTEVKTTAQESKKTEIPQVLDPSEYFAKAKKAADEKNIEEEYNNLQNYLLLAQSGKDEALWMLAQLYEGNTKYRDIKKAIETYEELKQNYPLSNYWEDANKRIIYLQRFYINIR